MFSHFHIFYFLYITFTFFFYLSFLFLFFFFLGVVMRGNLCFLCFWEKGYTETHTQAIPLSNRFRISAGWGKTVTFSHMRMNCVLLCCCFDYSFTLNSPQNIWKWVRVFVCIFELFREREMKRTEVKILISKFIFCCPK